jgi:hypothetical protein
VKNIVGRVDGAVSVVVGVVVVELAAAVSLLTYSKNGT